MFWCATCSVMGVFWLILCVFPVTMRASLLKCAQKRHYTRCQALLAITQQPLKELPRTQSSPNQRRFRLGVIRLRTANISRTIAPRPRVMWVLPGLASDAKHLSTMASNFEDLAPILMRELCEESSLRERSNSRPSMPSTLDSME